MNTKMKFLNLAIGLVLLASCSSNDELSLPADDEVIIHVGGVTRADFDSQDLNWLKDSLKSGLNIWYYKDVNDKKPGILKLQDDGSYTLTHGKDPCKWLGNGDHVFLGALVPKELKTASNANDYTALCRYTAMPPSTKIAATIGTITIPLQHRLARVVAYVLIDSIMGDKVQLKGYDTDPTHADNTNLRFCHVDVLKQVLTGGSPEWMKEKKATPHYLGEEHIIVYKEDNTGKLVFPCDSADYKKISNNTSGYTAIDYGKCPYYDIIVRPTYSKAVNSANVMPDELVTNQTDTCHNQIDFELTLNNDLEYEKHFEFDLNANEETVVYLRVTPERIDYNSAGSRLWKTEEYHDSYYGVDNQNGNTLSKSGSSWQRAFTNDTTKISVTDGHKYDADTDNDSVQYVSSKRWIKLLKQATKTATETGAHHGHYFILQNNIEIDVKDFPDGFVFTGHLDGLDHKITLIDSTNTGRNWLFSGIIGDWDAEVLNVKIEGGKLFKDGAEINGHVQNCTDITGSVEKIPTTLPTYKK